MTLRSSSPLLTRHGNITANRTQGLEQSLTVCPPFPNAYFESLDSSIPYFVNATLNAQQAIVTSFANLVVLLAMRHVTSIRLPSKLLLCSLVLTDLGAGLVVQPQFAAYVFLQGLDPRLVPCFLLESIGCTSVLFFTSSLFITAAISMDRYAALFHSVNYQQIVTSERVSVVLIVTWSLSLFFASTSLWNNALWDVAGIVCPLFSVLVCSVAYTRIYRRLRAVRIHPQAQHHAADQVAGNAPNMERYRATASAMMWVCLLLIACYLPFFVVVTAMRSAGHTVLTVCIREFAYTLLLLNSCINPFVYCLRVPDIRSEVKKRLRKCFS